MEISKVPLVAMICVKQDSQLHRSWLNPEMMLGVSNVYNECM